MRKIFKCCLGLIACMCFSLPLNAQPSANTTDTSNASSSSDPSSMGMQDKMMGPNTPTDGAKSMNQMADEMNRRITAMKNMPKCQSVDACQKTIDTQMGMLQGMVQVIQMQNTMMQKMIQNPGVMQNNPNPGMMKNNPGMMQNNSGTMPNNSGTMNPGTGSSGY